MYEDEDPYVAYMCQCLEGMHSQLLFFDLILKAGWSNGHKGQLRRQSSQVYQPSNILGYEALEKDGKKRDLQIL